jgi:type I restriction enzyme, S subunit
METEEVPFSELLSEIIDNRGKTCPTAAVGIPLIATNCIRNELLYPTYDKVRFVSQEIYNTWFRGHPKPGDIIFVNKATPGRVCLVPDPVDFCIAQDMVAVRANPKKVFPKYLFAVLRSPSVQEKIEQMHVGTLIPHFKKGDFDKLRLPIPTREIQEFVGNCYFDLSAKIALNRRMNETLESMARALFQSWFVDVTQAGLPKDWRESTIGEEVRVLGGSTPSTSKPEFWEGGTIHWATPKDLSNLSSPVLLDTERRITEAGLQEISSNLLPVGTVLLSSRAPIGYLVIAEVPVAVNQGFIAMVCDKSLPNYYILLWTRENMEVIKGRANGTTFMEISKSNFRPLPVVVPPPSVLGVFKKQVEPLYRRIVSNLRESRTLAGLRDALLPKLLSGELRVPVAAKLLAVNT